MSKRCILIGTRTVANQTVYQLTVESSLKATVTTETLAGVVTETRAYVGPRAEVQALITWTQLTGLIKKGRAA